MLCSGRERRARVPEEPSLSPSHRGIGGLEAGGGEGRPDAWGGGGGVMVSMAVGGWQGAPHLNLLPWRRTFARLRLGQWVLPSIAPTGGDGQPRGLTRFAAASAGCAKVSVGRRIGRAVYGEIQGRSI